MKYSVQSLLGLGPNKKGLGIVARVNIGLQSAGLQCCSLSNSKKARGASVYKVDYSNKSLEAFVPGQTPFVQGV